jgi:DNA polymerase-3 subunit delta'
MFRARMPFSEVIGQDRALSSLRSALRRGALHHAYLFGGPEGASKGLAARLLAQAANCEGGEAGPGGLREDACGTCGPCRKIAKGVHPDVLVLAEERVMAKAGTWEPRGGRTPSKDVVVDQIRDVVDRRLALRRFEGRRRFVIVDPADAMNPQAQNALLKTLEEPPDETTLVLVASNPDGLLPTIRSRCLRVSFGPVAPGAIAAALEGEGIAADVARLAAELSGGVLERARDLARREAAARAKGAADPDARAGPLSARRDLLARGVSLDPRDAGAWIAFAAAAGKEREGLAALCEEWLLFLRDVLAAQAGAADGALALSALAPEARRWAATLSAAEVARRRLEVLRTLEGLKQNASPVLALERLLVRWFHGG